MQAKKLILSTIALLCFLPSVLFAQGAYIEAPSARVHSTSGPLYVLADGAQQISILNNVGSTATGFYLDATTGTLTSVGGSSISAPIIIGASSTFASLLGSASQTLIGTNTADASDNKSLFLEPGDAVSTNGSRGGAFIADGNEVATTGGSASLLAGNVSTANATIGIEHASSSIIFKDITTGTLWSITDAGVLTQNATNGGSLVMSKEDTGILFGTTALDADVLAVSGSTPHFGMVENSGNQDQFAIVQDGGNANGVQMRFYKTRSANPASDANTIVQASDTLGTLGWFGADGADYKQAASIRTIVDGAPNTNVMPGALIFSTKNTSATLDRLKIDSSGNLTVDATNGGDILIPKAQTGLVVGEAARAANVTTITAQAAPLYIAGTANSTHLGAFVGFGNVTNGGTLDFLKTRATSGAASTIVTSGDTLGRIQFFGANGTGYDPAASIVVTSNGTPGASADMPGAIDFQTTPDGSATLASVLKLDNAKLATFTGKITSTTTSDIGWALVAGANTACNTTCTSACIVGQDTATFALKACTDATSDVCLCAGAS